MKICYLCGDPGIPVLGRKGCSTHVRETTRSLQAAGHETFIITPNPGDDSDGNSDIEILKVPGFTTKKVGSDLRHYLYNHRLVHEATQIFVQRRPDVIYERYALYSTAGATLARRFLLPRILEVNSFLVHEQKERLHFNRIAHWFEKRIIRTAPYTVVVSSPLRDAFIKLGVDSQRIMIMPMAVDIKTFNPECSGIDLRTNFDIPEDYLIVGYVGTLTGWHGINLLYDAAQLLKERQSPVVFLILGGDPQKVKAHRLKVNDCQLSDGLRFAGSVSYQDVPHYISSLDVCLIPNSHHWASPTKMFEYQAMGKPVVAPRLIPIEDAMTHQQEGLLFEPQNVKEMVEHIELLRSNPEMRLSMGRRARARVIKNHAWENNVKRIIEVFEQMLEEKKQRYAF